jgi:phospholipid/cholesterol/gamma-HCH transport system permease protein
MQPLPSLKPALKRDPGDVVARAGSITYNLQGDWTVDQAAACMQALQALGTVKKRTIILQGSLVQRLDITGAWLLVDLVDRFKKQSTTVSFEGFADRSAYFIDQAKTLKQLPPEEPVKLKPLDVRIAEYSVNIANRAVNGLAFVGWFWILFGRTLLRPVDFRFRTFVKQCDVVAVRAAPIVAFMSFLIAIVLAYQGAAQLRRFGAEIFSIDLVTISVLREMGVLLTAIMVAGRSGSAFAAEIGTMKLNEELDALKTTGMEPMEVLVLPRVIALTLMMPLLTFLGDMASFVGAGLLTVTTTKTSLLLFEARLTGAIHMKDFWIGIGKAPVFGLMIGLIGCYHGMSVANSAESVGRETTNAVVNAIFAVMLADALFSIMFTLIGI